MSALRSSDPPPKEVVRKGKRKGKEGFSYSLPSEEVIACTEAG